MDPEIQKNMGAVRMYRQQQQNCMAKIQALSQTAKRVELTAKEIGNVRKTLYENLTRNKLFQFYFGGKPFDLDNFEIRQILYRKQNLNRPRKTKKLQIMKKLI